MLVLRNYQIRQCLDSKRLQVKGLKGYSTVIKLPDIGYLMKWSLS